MWSRDGVAREDGWEYVLRPREAVDVAETEEQVVRRQELGRNIYPFQHESHDNVPHVYKTHYAPWKPNCAFMSSGAQIYVQVRELT